MEQRVLRYAQHDKSLTHVLNAPDTAFRIVREVQFAVASLGQTHGTSAQFGGLPCRGVDESIHEQLEVTARLPVHHRLKYDPEALLRLRRAIPGAMEYDECAVAVPLGKLLP